MVGGALLGVVAGALGTAVHLNLASLPGGWTLPWGAVLALVLAGSVQRWWMRRTAERGGARQPASAIERTCCSATCSSSSLWATTTSPSIR